MAHVHETDDTQSSNSLLGRAVAMLSRHEHRKLRQGLVTSVDELYPSSMFRDSRSDAALAERNLERSMQTNEPFRGHHIVHGVAGSGKTTQLREHAVSLNKERQQDRRALKSPY